MLTNAVLEWTGLVQDQLSSSLVIKASHVFLPLVCVLDVRYHFLERTRMCRCGAVLEFVEGWTGLLLVELLHVGEFRLSYKLAFATWSEGTTESLLASVLSEEVLARILVFVTDGVGLKLVESISCSSSASSVGEVSLFSDHLGISSVLLIVSGRISNSEVDGDGEQSSSLASSLGLDSLSKLLSVFVESGLLVK